MKCNLCQNYDAAKNKELKGVCSVLEGVCRQCRGYVVCFRGGVQCVGGGVHYAVCVEGVCSVLEGVCTMQCVCSVWRGYAVCGGGVQCVGGVCSVWRGCAVCWRGYAVCFGGGVQCVGGGVYQCMVCFGGGVQCVEGRVGGCYLSKMDFCLAILNRLLTDFGAFCETDSLCGMVGRPSYIVSYEQLLFLIENGFSVPQIADMIGVSVRTVRRRMTEFGLAIRARYSLIVNWIQLFRKFKSIFLFVATDRCKVIYSLVVFVCNKLV